MKRTILALSVVALLGAAPAGAQDLGNFVVLGDSVAAGFAHLGLMDCYQERTWPALVAHEAGAVDFQLPLVSEPGIPAMTQLVALEVECRRAGRPVVFVDLPIEGLDDEG